MVPEAVIEAMAEAIAQDDEWYSPNGTRYLYRQDAKRAIAAAEKLGWRLCPREPTNEQIDACPRGNVTAREIWRAMWDVA